MREGYAVELRNKKRADALIKRRTKTRPSMKASPENLKKSLQSTDPRIADPELNIFDEMLILKDILLSQHPHSVHHMALTLLRDLLTAGKDAPVNESVELGLGEAVLLFCNPGMPDELVEEAAWCLCNMASGNEATTEAIVKLGAVASLLSLVQSSNPLVLEHSIWAIGNVIGDSVELRTVFLDKRIVLRFSELTENYNEEMLNVYPVIAWTCSNIMRRSPIPAYNYCHGICNILTRLATFEANPTLSADLLWSISNFTDQENMMIQLVIDSAPLFNFVVSNLKSRDNGMVKAALRCAGNIVSGNMVHTQAMLDKGFLDYVVPMLANPDSTVRKEAFWSLSNIAASSFPQVELLMSHPVMERAPYGLIDQSEAVVKEASYLFCNLCKLSNDQIILKLVYSYYILDHLAQGLTSQTQTTLMNLLIVCDNILSAGIRNPTYQSSVGTIFYEKGCHQALERLQMHDSSEISRAAVQILNQFYEEKQHTPRNEFAVPAVFNFS